MADRDGDAASLRVQVAYALPHRQWLLTVRVPAGATVAEAIAASGIEQRVRGLVIDPHRIGVFGKPCAPDAPLHDGDRVELYRPLECDPKEVRRQRAEAERSPQRRP